FKNKILYTLPVILSAVSLGLIFPSSKSTYLIFILLLPLIHTLKKQPEKASGNSFIFGFFLSASACYWIFFNSGTELWIRIFSGLGLFVINALYYALFGFIYKHSHRLIGKKAIWILPLLWGGMETAMLFEEFAFPWTYIAHTMTGKTEFIQIAEFLGVTSVSIAVLYISILTYKFFSNIFNKNYFPAFIRIQLAVLLFTGLLIFGRIRLNSTALNTDDADIIKAVLIHPGLDVEYKWEKKNFQAIINAQMALSRSSLMHKPDLIIWGESNFPGYLENYPSYTADFILFAAEKKVDLCIGSLGYDFYPETDSFKKFNSTFFFDQKKHVSRYDKRKLVPFGESFPFAWVLTFLKDISLGQANFDKGENNKPFEMTSENKFHTNICYEALFPYYNASLVRKGSEFIVNVSNDAWYDGTRQVFQHSRFNVFRAVENRRSIVRLANKAENSLFLPTGEQQILFYNKKNTHKTISVPLNEQMTFFSLYGRYFALFLLLLNGSVLVAGLLKRKKLPEKI
ncbi:MAG: apolipoprotein N-acyltransferase, partial [Candidatus Delongbacteria bacterium]